MAAVLVCGDGAALSHRSAAALWGITEERMGAPVHVTVRRRMTSGQADLRVHARPALSPGRITSRRGVPVTTPVQTLVDLVAEADRYALERAINQADKLDLVDPESLRAALEGHAGEPGVPALRRVLDRHTFRLSDSDLEVWFRPLAAEAGLPAPLSKQFLDGYEVDFFFPAIGLVVETDGWRYHRTPAAQTRDAERFQAHTAAGLTPLRFSHWQIRHEPAHVRGILRRTLRMIEARAAPAGGASER